MFISPPRDRYNQVAATAFLNTNLHPFRWIKFSTLCWRWAWLLVNKWAIIYCCSGALCWPECVLVASVLFPITWSLQGCTSVLASSLFLSIFTASSESPVLQWSSDKHMESQLARSTIMRMVVKFVCEFIKSYCHGVPRWVYRNVSLWPHMEMHFYVQLVLLAV